MQATLRDRYRVQATTLTCTLLVASVIATAFAFAGGSVRVSIVGIRAERSTWLGWFAVFTFALTLVDLVIDRRGAAGERDDAVRQLAALKSHYRTPPEPGTEIQDYLVLRQGYEMVMDGLPAVPESQFLPLKAKHLRKIEVSRYLSSHPGMSSRAARRAVKKGHPRER